MASILRKIAPACMLGGSRAMSTGVERKVCVVGAAGGIGQSLSMLMKMNPAVTQLSLYDVMGTPGVAADVSHMNTKVRGARSRRKTPIGAEMGRCLAS
jgi:malate dehydrogenase